MNSNDFLSSSGLKSDPDLSLDYYRSSRRGHCVIGRTVEIGRHYIPHAKAGDPAYVARRFAALRQLVIAGAKAQARRDVREAEDRAIYAARAAEGLNTLRSLYGADPSAPMDWPDGSAIPKSFDMAADVRHYLSGDGLAEDLPVRIVRDALRRAEDARRVTLSSGRTLGTSPQERAALLHALDLALRPFLPSASPEDSPPDSHLRHLPPQA